MGSRIFVLSPARLDGERARLLFNPEGRSEIAKGLRTRTGVPIGEVYQFVSSLYFRGKLAYAKKFARPPEPNTWLGSGALVITANRGIVPVETRVVLEQLEAFAETNIDHREKNFRGPLERDAAELAKSIGPESEAILLGSIASKKYVEPLLKMLGDQLLFPSDFVGRGDMSRGGLLLRAVEANTELNYARVNGAERHGARPPKLPKKTSVR